MPPRPKSSSPWVIDTRSLGRRPGTLKVWRARPPVDEPIGLEVIAVPVGALINVDLRLESVAEGVLVSGRADGTAEGECSRCLRPVTQPVRADLRELYAYPDSTTAATTDEDEIPRLIDDLIDTEPLVRDEIVLALPLVPLCRPDCTGLCVQCGERLDDLEPGHSHEILDPRWAALVERFGMTAGPGTQDDVVPGAVGAGSTPGSDPSHGAPGPVRTIESGAVAGRDHHHLEEK